MDEERTNSTLQGGELGLFYPSRKSHQRSLYEGEVTLISKITSADKHYAYRAIVCYLRAKGLIPGKCPDKQTALSLLHQTGSAAKSLSEFFEAQRDELIALYEARLKVLAVAQAASEDRGRLRREGYKTNAEKYATRRRERDESYRKFQAFYLSPEWRRLRYEAFKKYGRKCHCCGATDRLHVDHIKPRSKHPELELDIENTQILCEDCNLGKGGWDETDWR